MAAVEAGTGRLDPSNERPWGAVRQGYSRFQENDVLFAKITPCMENGKVALARGLRSGVGAGSTEFHVLRPTSVIEPRFLLWALLREELRRKARLRMTGSAGQLRVPLAFLESQELDFPPLEEQRRIVAALDSHFSRLDEAEAGLERVQRNLKRYRASVLQAAVAGSLVPTEAELARAEGRENPHLMAHHPEPRRGEPRKGPGRLWGAGEIPALTEAERSALPKGWRWVKLRHLGTPAEDVVQVGPMSMRSADFTASGVPVLNVGAVRWDGFDENRLNYLPLTKVAPFSRYRIRPGDVLFTRSGTVGRCAVAQDHQDGWLMTFHLLRARVAADVCLPRYLRAVLEGAPHIQRQTRGGSVGTTRSGFNTNLLADLDVPLPPLAEQHRIMDEVERRLSEARSLAADISSGLARCAPLRQSILKWAFEGKLVDQDPSDEPAGVLLAGIRAERAAAGPGAAASRRGRSKRTS